MKDDLISRQAALKRKFMAYYTNGAEIKQIEAVPVREIEKLPAMDAVPARHGKWVDENGNRPYGCGSYRFNWLCSECGRPQHTSTAKLLKEFEEEHRWCHFCGARMDGEDGEQT